jgi:hypothetical protein
MKLTAHISINFPLLPVTSSLAGIVIPSPKGHSININIKTGENPMTGKGILVYAVPATGNTINITSITDYKNNRLALQNAGGNILSSTTLSKASVELPSLATVTYFVRVKNKVSGEATILRYVKI